MSSGAAMLQWGALPILLAGLAAAESQCDCTGNYFNPITRTCASTTAGMPTDWSGNTFLYDIVEEAGCPSLSAWGSFASEGGYRPIATDDQCSCVASNTINIATDTDTATGYSWDYTTGTCVNGPLKYTGPQAKSNQIDVKECSYKLVNGYPSTFSHCGSLNVCQCYIAFHAVKDAAALNPGNNANGNALNLEGLSNGQTCGWSFLQQKCVPQSTDFSGIQFYLESNKNTAFKICRRLGYFLDQPGRVPNYLTTEYVYVSPTIAACAAKSGDKCACNEDARCFMADENNCAVHLVSDVEVNRTSSNVTAELVAEQCGNPYCNTLSAPCTCYETPYKGGNLCGWDPTSSSCKADFETDRVEMFKHHCCDAFKTPCECKVGRLPWSGTADHDNTCGWDQLNNVCRLSALTDTAEIVTSGCDVAGGCFTVDEESKCNTTVCAWLPGRHSCIPIA